MNRLVAIVVTLFVACISMPTLQSARAITGSDSSWNDGGSTNGTSATLWAAYQHYLTDNTFGTLSDATNASVTAQQLWWRATWERLFADPTCASYGNCVPALPFAEPTGQAVTIADLKSFTPVAPTLTSEPTDWAILGRPINFIAAPGGGVVAGELIGRAAEVEFAATHFRFDFGDGTVLETDSPGSTWSSLALATFTDTSTSHRYTVAGAVTINLTATYSVRYRFSGGSWRQMNGSVTAAALPLAIKIFGGRSALVDRTCTEIPAGVGC